jgi:glutathione synthase/RimK-type ligase-like ATP-grasp enzyme
MRSSIPPVAWRRPRRRAGHEVRVIDVLRCYMNITSHRPSIHYKGEELTGFDAVIPRIGASVTFYGTAVLRQFEMLGTYCLNESVAITRSRDKLRSLQLLSRKGIGLPVTGFAHAPDDITDLIRMVGGAPVVIKLLEGTQGIGVVWRRRRRRPRASSRPSWGSRPIFWCRSTSRRPAAPTSAASSSARRWSRP